MQRSGVRPPAVHQPSQLSSPPPPRIIQVASVDLTFLAQSGVLTTVRLFESALFVSVRCSGASTIERCSRRELRPASQTGKGTPGRARRPHSAALRHHPRLRSRLRPDAIRAACCARRPPSKAPSRSSGPGACGGSTPSPSARSSSPTASGSTPISPRDKQVIVSPMPAERPDHAGVVSRPAAAIWSATSPPASQKCPGLHPAPSGLKLVPKKTDPEIEWLILGVDATTLQIRHLVAARSARRAIDVSPSII